MIYLILTIYFHSIFRIIFENLRFIVISIHIFNIIMKKVGIAVIGSGTMGHGIAEVCAIHGYEVILLDISEEILQNSIQRIIWSLNKLKQSGKLKEKIEEILKK